MHNLIMFNHVWSPSHNGGTFICAQAELDDLSGFVALTRCIKIPSYTKTYYQNLLFIRNIYLKIC